MRRLIDANALMDSIIDQLEIEWGYEGIREDVKRIFENAPTVDAVEVVHGRWIHKHFDDVCGGWYNEWHCSVCGGRAYEKGFNYCPNCGAKMDGDGNG